MLRLVFAPFVRFVPKRILHILAVYFVLAPEMRKSAEAARQVLLLGRTLPHVRRISRVVWRRDWGVNASLALTPILEVPVEDVVRGEHSEIEAWMRGEDDAMSYYRNLVLGGDWSEQDANKRREKTARLMAADPQTFVSEANLVLEGQLMLHDGYHRAAIRKAKGFTTARIQVTLSLNLR